MKLVTFGIDTGKNLLIQSRFHPTIYPAVTDLYQVETVPVPIVDQNKQTNSFTHLKIDRPYIALNPETYISIRQQEL